MTDPAMDMVCAEDTRYHLAELCIRAAEKKGVSVATAESCTGGLISGALTDVPGSSAVLRGAVVSYAVDIKHSILGVDAGLLEREGPVNAETAVQMAAGVRRKLEADIAISTTGIAGPGGEEPGKPVGTVWFGVSGPSGTRSFLRHFEGNRMSVRESAVAYALETLLQEIESI